MIGPERPVIMLTGANGQVGFELRRSLAEVGEVFAFDRGTLDLTRFDDVRAAVRSLRPDVIVNAAAYTQVDRAELEPELAMLMNGRLPGVLADEAAATNAILIHYSTDYVFRGDANRPYVETDATGPINEYGRTKLAGDAAVMEARGRSYVFRVGWVYGLRGRNFLRTVQRLAAEQTRLRVVADQFGGPTWSVSIAEATAAVLSHLLNAHRNGAQLAPPGLYHLSPSDHASWFEFATAILAGSKLRAAMSTAVDPIGTEEYPTAAARPRWSVMSSDRLREAFGLSLPLWREQLARCLA